MGSNLDVLSLRYFCDINGKKMGQSSEEKSGLDREIPELSENK